MRYSLAFPFYRNGKECVAVDLELCNLFQITPQDIQERKRFLQLHESDDADIGVIREVIATNIDAIVDEFYVHIALHQQMERFLSDRRTVDRLKQEQRKYLESFGRDINSAAYFEDRLRIGVVHEKIGLGQRWYLGSYSILFGIIASHIKTRLGLDTDAFQRLLFTMHKVFTLDAILTVETYHQAATQRLDAILAQLTQAHNNLQELSRLDGLTGLVNRKFVMESLEMEVHRSHRFQHPFLLALIDVDHFKAINDRYGHPCGDYVLKACAQTIRKALRPADIVGRYGGEEFAVGLVECDTASAEHILDRVRLSIANTVFQFEEEKISVTISIGAMPMCDAADRIELMLRKADDALYSAKEAGRNRVQIGA